MLRYTDFMLESLILESIVYYSDKFKKILSTIDSPVAKTLLDMESKDLDIVNNYLDIVDREQISFIPDRRAGQIIQANQDKVTYTGNRGFLSHSDANKNIFARLDYTPQGETTYHPSTGEEGVILSTTQSPTSDRVYCKVQFPGGISVINKERLRKVEIDKLLYSQNRQPIRIGRGIRAMLKPSGVTFTDSEIEDFVNKYKAAWDKMNDIFRNFEVVKEDKIAYWYNSINYAARTSTLGSSCMSNVEDEYFDIYVNNPEKISLVILKNDDGDKILGRALLWELDQPKITFMDRIYTASDSYIQLFKDYCYKMGWYHKVHQNSGSSEILNIDSAGNKTVKSEALQTGLKTLRAGDYQKFPYLDTLKYFNISTGVISSDYNFKRSSHHNVYTLEVTDGTWSENQECDTCGGSGEVECYECGGSGQMDCTECRQRVGRIVRSTGSVSCGECGGEGEVDCGECNGTGKVDGEDCADCTGSGRVTCTDCDGDGKNDCPECGGSTEVECTECGGSGTISCSDCS